MALDHDAKNWLQTRFSGNITFDEPMAKHTSFRVGGPADAFITPENQDKLALLVTWAEEQTIPYMIIGGGTNLLIKDSGIRGIVISMKKGLKNIAHEHTKKDIVMVAAMASAGMQSFCRFAVENGLEGMNFALGIPGTIGGGIAMNAGTSEGSIENVLKAVKVLLPDGTIKTHQKKELDFSYRKLSWHKQYAEAPIILEGYFCLKPGDSKRLKKEAEDLLKARRKKQPTPNASAGCFFKNPPFGKTAGQLIEMAGLKGKTKGGAKISPKHANYIINTGKASAANILDLMTIVQKTVYKKFNINLIPEVKIVG